MNHFLYCRRRRSCNLPLLLLTPVVALFCLPASAQKAVRPCGVERWDVKTLSDNPAAKKVNVDNPEAGTIEFLASLKSPLDKKPQKQRLAAEYKAYRINALLIGYKRDTDQDFHIVVADPSNRRITMIVEIPDPQCDGAKSSGYAEKYQRARSEIMHLLGSGRGFIRASGDIVVVITGVAFFDVIRGQTGQAKNGIELHPVVAVGPP